MTDSGAPPPAADGSKIGSALDRKAFDRILTFGVERGISDVHLEVGQPPHLRLQGDLLPAKYASLRAEDTEAIAKMLLGEDYPAFKKMRQERDMTYSIEGVSRFRATIFWQQGFVGVVLRVIPLLIRNFDQLNLPACLEDICLIRRGLIMVTGATGNGKSTTLAAMLQRINQTRRAHIVTIEDPIEFLFPKEKSLIIQREIGSDTGSFRDALKAALRQDPDIIMVGEVRDYETAEICLKGAETGHLIMTAIHTPDAASTIQRFAGLFAAEEQEAARLRLAETLRATLSLRLLPTSDAQSRVPAVEVMRVTRTIQECIRNPDKVSEIPAHIQRGGDLYAMQSFDQHIVQLFKQQRISLDVARMAATNPDELERSLTID